LCYNSVINNTEGIMINARNWQLKTYDQKLAYVARREDERQHAERQSAKARQQAKRAELQADFDAVMQWQDEQFAQHGMTSTIIAQTQTKLDALNAIVKAA
jgi:hypothetical protein